MTEIKAFDRLKELGLTLACAESFTGGEIASKLVHIAGASEILSLSAVCYSNEAKQRVLGVPSKVIAEFGAVSGETVDKMLDGLIGLGLSDVQVATSGNAGPTSEKPDEVGVAYIGAAYGNRRVIKRLNLSGSRSEIIEAGAEEALGLVCEILD